MYSYVQYHYDNKYFNCKWRKCEMIAYTFCIDSMVWGYHEYQYIWDNPLEDGDILCEWETGSLHNPQCMAIKKVIDGTLPMVEHVTRKISSICLIYIRRGGSIACRLTRHWQYRIVLNFDGRKVWWIWQMDVESSKFSYQNFSVRKFC